MPPTFFKAKKQLTKKQKSVSSPYLFISSNLIYMYILIFSESGKILGFKEEKLLDSGEYEKYRYCLL